MPTSGFEPPTFRLQGERNNHYATQASNYSILFHLVIKTNICDKKINYHRIVK